MVNMSECNWPVFSIRVFFVSYSTRPNGKPSFDLMRSLPPISLLPSLCSSLFSLSSDLGFPLLFSSKNMLQTHTRYSAKKDVASEAYRVCQVLARGFKVHKNEATHKVEIAVQRLWKGVLFPVVCPPGSCRWQRVLGYT